ncbi:pilus assembly protein N-terminal domain-containing protein [Faunimonas sp. B44]|uniref:pilus assembly protein N-terminal domain-containing protein n=1 Tax=Faunimonas sp. B44 TaxID=3461493 RepID=UPI004043A239
MGITRTLVARRSKFALAVAAAILTSPAALAADVIDVTIDFAKILKLDRPAGTLVIGNPGIADATVGDDTTVVLTGKAAGTTNLIILDAKGEEMANALVRVSSDTRQLTTVFYGSKRHSFSCAPQCEQVISVGDEKEAFDNARAQIQSRQEFSGAR